MTEVKEVETQPQATHVTLLIILPNCPGIYVNKESPLAFVSKVFHAV